MAPVVDAAARRRMIGSVRIPEVLHPGVLRAAGIATLALVVAIELLGAPLRNAQAPLGIVSLQLAASPAVAEAILTSWASIPRSRLLWTHGLDLLLPVAYATLVVAIASRAADRTSVAAHAAGIAGVAGIVAACADQIENLAMALTILTTPSWGSVLVTLVAAVVKFATLALALAALGAALWSARARAGITP